MAYGLSLFSGESRAEQMERLYGPGGPDWRDLIDLDDTPKPLPLTNCYMRYNKYRNCQCLHCQGVENELADQAESRQRRIERERYEEYERQMARTEQRFYLKLPDNSSWEPAEQIAARLGGVLVRDSWPREGWGDPFQGLEVFGEPDPRGAHIRYAARYPRASEINKLLRDAYRFQVSCYYNGASVPPRHWLSSDDRKNWPVWDEMTHRLNSDGKQVCNAPHP